MGCGPRADLNLGIGISKFEITLSGWIYRLEPDETENQPE